MQRVVVNTLNIDLLVRAFKQPKKVTETINIHVCKFVLNSSGL